MFSGGRSQVWLKYFALLDSFIEANSKGRDFLDHADLNFPKMPSASCLLLNYRIAGATDWYLIVISIESGAELSLIEIKAG